MDSVSQGPAEQSQNVRRMAQHVGGVSPGAKTAQVELRSGRVAPAVYLRGLANVSKLKGSVEQYVLGHYRERVD